MGRLVDRLFITAVVLNILVDVLFHHEFLSNNNNDSMKRAFDFSFVLPVVVAIKSSNDNYRSFWGFPRKNMIFFNNKKPTFLLSTVTTTSATTSLSGAKSSTSAVTNNESIVVVDDDDDLILKEELDRCDGIIIDPHLHTAPWFDTSEQLIEELEANNVSIGLLYDPYPRMNFILPYDVNTKNYDLASSSNGKIWMLASLNTTHDNWTDHRIMETERLREFLLKPEVLGCKLAPPHTALPLYGPVMDDIVATVAASPRSKLLAIHIGTTPFLGPIGQSFGLYCNGTLDYVDPTRLLPYIEQYPDVTFILLHSGHEFLPPDNEYYYNFTNVDKCISMAQKYPNVYLSLSALFAQTPDGIMKYPGGDMIVQKIKDAKLCHKTFWGSDASYFQNQIRPVLISAIKSMRKAGWTESERTWALHGLAKELFQIPIRLDK